MTYFLKISKTVDDKLGQKNWRKNQSVKVNSALAFCLASKISDCKYVDYSNNFYD